MKNLALSLKAEASIKDIVLETVVSAHYLVLQLRLLAGEEDFLGHAETELMANALSRWAQLASSKWRDGDGACFAPFSGADLPMDASRHNCPARDLAL